MAVLGVAASLLGGLFGSSSAKKAAAAEAAAAREQTALNERIYEETVDRFAPYADAGLDYEAAYRFETLGGPRPVFGGDPLDVTEFTETYETPNGGYNALNPYWNARGGVAQTPNITHSRTRYRVGDQIFDTRDAADQYAQANPTGGYEYGGFEKSPWQNYLLEQSQRATEGSAAARGTLHSGATLRAIQDRATDLTGSFYDNYLNRLAQGAASGQAAAGNQANAGANFLQTGTNALANLGNAQAAGAIGSGNAIMGGINNAVGLWNYQSNQSQPNMLTASNGIRIPNSLFNQVQGVL